MTSFAGFEMPLWYEGIIPEHLSVRHNVGLFDISHMGRVLVVGADSEKFLNNIITNNVSRLQRHDAQYSVMCNDNGGIIDDFVVYRLELDKFLLVFNAGNREKDFNWLVLHSQAFDVTISEISDEAAMFAVQGPKAAQMLQKISSVDLSRIERFKCTDSTLADVDVFMSRTGYTGEDGFEIFVWNASLSQPEEAIRLWNEILETGESYSIKPCGLGSRDTLRIEAGLCLYGNDIAESITPLEARLSFVVDFGKESFIGKESLMKQKSGGIKCRRIGLRIIGRGIPRAGFDIFNDEDVKIGHVTSGSFSPLLEVGVGMGYIQKTLMPKNNVVYVKIRNSLVEGRIIRFPAYNTKEYGYKRVLLPG
jgi:aminomethyltransferase